jgi:hypothetical protein
VSRRRSTGGRFNLGDPWDGQLDDFCSAHHTASATDIVRKALDMFIPADLARNQGVAETYERLQAKRKRAKEQADGEKSEG